MRSKVDIVDLNMSCFNDRALSLKPDQPQGDVNET